MTRLAARLWTRTRAPRRRWGLAAFVLLAAGLGSGWVEGDARSDAPSVPYPSSHRPPPAAPAALQARLDELARAYGEPVGVAVVDVESGWTAQVDGQEIFPQQSVSKLWVALAVLDAVDRGGLKLDQWAVMRPEDRSVFYQPLGERITDHGIAVSLAELLRWAITESDNAANDKLMREVGGAGVVTQTVAKKGLSGVRVGAYERDLQARICGLTWRADYAGWNFKAARARLKPQVRDAAMAAYLADPPDGASPAAIAHALAALKRGELLSEDSTAFLLGLMAEARTGPMRLKGGLPPGWSIAHKTGTGQDWRGAAVGINDVGVITAPDGRSYAVAVMMRRTKQAVPERLAFMQAVTRAVVNSWTAEAAARVGAVGGAGR